MAYDRIAMVEKYHRFLKAKRTPVLCSTKGDFYISPHATRDLVFLEDRVEFFCSFNGTPRHIVVNDAEFEGLMYKAPEEDEDDDD